MADTKCSNFSSVDLFYRLVDEHEKAKMERGKPQPMENVWDAMYRAVEEVFSEIDWSQSSIDFVGSSELRAEDYPQFNAFLIGMLCGQRIVRMGKGIRLNTDPEDRN